MGSRQLADLKGKVLIEIRGAEYGSERVTFVCSDGSRYAMYHEQDCCETVTVDEVIGNPDELLGDPIVEAYESWSKIVDAPDSGTWTFYRIATASTVLVIRWRGVSNGYYAEGVTFNNVTAYPEPEDI